MVGIVLAGQAAASSVQDDSPLIDHPAPSNELTKEELLEALGEIHYDGKRQVSKYVADHLYRTEDKTTTEVVEGLTVSDLIAQNHVSLGDCSQEALKKRADVYFKTAGHDVGTRFAVNMYLLKCLQEAADFCVQNKYKIIGDEINEQSWMWQLDLVYETEYDPEHYFNPEFNLPNWRSSVARFIKDGTMEAGDV